MHNPKFYRQSSFHSGEAIIVLYLFHLLIVSVVDTYINPIFILAIFSGSSTTCRDELFLLRIFFQGGAPPIPNLRLTCQAIIKIRAFKVCLMFFIFYS